MRIQARLEYWNSCAESCIAFRSCKPDYDGPGVGAKGASTESRRGSAGAASSGRVQQPEEKDELYDAGLASVFWRADLAGCSVGAIFTELGMVKPSKSLKSVGLIATLTTTLPPQGSQLLCQNMAKRCQIPTLLNTSNVMVLSGIPEKSRTQLLSSQAPFGLAQVGVIQISMARHGAIGVNAWWCFTCWVRISHLSVALRWKLHRSSCEGNWRM
jgi:hypothetical protein